MYIYICIKTATILSFRQIVNGFCSGKNFNFTGEWKVQMLLVDVLMYVCMFLCVSRVHTFISKEYNIFHDYLPAILMSRYIDE